MPTTQISDWSETSFYTKKAGMEPLSGYVLIEPLGRGGFGEVWKCEAPGGLHKAVKFVGGSENERTSDVQLRQEYEAFQQVKAIRHPYLLCLERVELVGNELVMVMGLADRQLGDRFHECQQSGLQGIPREELLGYLQEAAEALDVISTQYGLQHLDVKPANLFLTAGHVQVGDYGLVSKLEAATGTGKTRGLTPRYAAPEVLRGQVHTQSDQYSLALVYQELLTGTFPFTGRSSQQYMLQHTSEAPDLSGLPERDRGSVGTALSKQPGDRFISCRAFIKSLSSTRNGSSRLSLITPGQKSTPSVETAPHLITTPAPLGINRPLLNSPLRGPAASNQPTHRNHLDETSPPSARVAKLVGVERTTPPRVSDNVVSENVASPPPTQPLQTIDSLGVKLQRVLSVLPVGWLRGRDAPDPDLPPNDMVRAVLAAAGTGGATLAEPVGVACLPDGNWACRFLTTIDPRVAKVKLDLLWERGGLTMDARDDRRVIFRQPAPVPQPPQGVFTLFGKKPAPPPTGGLEVVVELPEKGLAVGEVSAHGRLFGSPPTDFVESSREVIATLLEEVRKQLNNFQDRRKHPRIPVDFPVTLFPLNADYRIQTPVSGRCQNVSAGGLALRTTSPPTTKYAYVAFEGVPGTTGLALLFQIIRAEHQAEGIYVTGRYRLDFWPAKV